MLALEGFYRKLKMNPERQDSKHLLRLEDFIVDNP